jgi:hypothetical protein
MKKLSPSLIMLAVLGLSQGAQAANWLELQGNEPANAPTFKLWGFLQPTYTYNKADKISGLVGAPNTPYNGHYIIPNLVGPDSTDKQAFQFNRARLGVRGVLNPVDKRINYFVLLEAGRNALTREHSVVLSTISRVHAYASACSNCPPVKKRWCRYIPLSIMCIFPMSRTTCSMSARSGPSPLLQVAVTHRQGT